MWCEQWKLYISQGLHEETYFYHSRAAIQLYKFRVFTLFKCGPWECDSFKSSRICKSHVNMSHILKFLFCLPIVFLWPNFMLLYETKKFFPRKVLQLHKTYITKSITVLFLKESLLACEQLADHRKRSHYQFIHSWGYYFGSFKPFNFV